MQSDALAIRVRGLQKSFRIPEHRVQTLKERAMHPLRRTNFHKLRALRDIELEVAQGEFFGIVGRNGSGKSTLLKCLAGIYAADAGTIDVAGRLSPFIELGVGFNPDLPARDNVTINAVMMGLSQQEAKDRFDDIIAFAELERFVDTKLKNYSSGMQVRLAFSVMVQSDPDVMLIDEVLAVGDAAFQQKCVDQFYRLRGEGKTIVLVTHVMSLVEQFCHRAMMLSNGRVAQVGEPGEIGRAYLSENFRSVVSEDREGTEGEEIRLLDAWITDERGRRIDSIAFGETMCLHMTLEAVAPVHDPGITMWVTNEDGVRVFTVGARENGEPVGTLGAGERAEFSVELDNRLSAGRYYLGCGVTRGSAGLEILLFQDRAADIVSYGAELHGLVGVDHAGSFTRLGAREPVR